jgi:hypothetical protein
MRACSRFVDPKLGASADPQCLSSLEFLGTRMRAGSRGRKLEGSVSSVA